MNDKPRRRWFAFRLRTIFALVAIAAFAAALLTRFESRFRLVHLGATRNQVEILLGTPTSETGLAWGSAAREAWHYRRGNRDYAVVFGDGPNVRREQWTVVHSISRPTDDAKP